MRKCCFVFTLLFVLSWFSSAMAIPVVYVKDSLTDLNISEEVEVLQGHSAATWPWEVQSSKHWHKQENSYFNFLNNANTTTTWFRFAVRNRSGDDQTLILSVDSNFLNIVDLYVRNSRGALERVWYAGLDRGLATKPYPSGTFSFPIYILNRDSKYIYCKVNSNYHGPLDIKLANQDVFNRQDTIEKVVNGIIMGMLLLVCLYSLAMFIFIHEIRFMYYSLFTFSLICCLLLTGSYMTLLAPIIANVGTISLFTCTTFTMHLGLLLTMSNFMTTKNKVVHGLLWSVAGGLLLCAILTWFIPSYVTFKLLLVSLGIMLIWAMCMVISALRVHNLVNFGYGVSAVCFIGGCTIPFLCAIGVLVGDIYSKITFFSVATSVGIVFSLMLGWRTYQEKMNRMSVLKNAILRYRRYLQLLNFSSDGLFSLTIEGELKQVNPAFCKMLGYSGIQDMYTNGVYTFQALCVNSREFENLVSSILGRIDNDKVAQDISYLDTITEKQELQLIHISGRYVSVMVSIRLSEDINGMYTIEGEAIDQTTNEEYQSQLEFVANHDEVTGVFNRRYMMTSLKNVYKQKADQGTGMGCDYLCFLRIDNFKFINSVTNHAHGDEVLRSVVNCLQRELKEGHELIRLNSDEFAIIMPNSYVDETLSAAEKWRAELLKLRFSFDNELYSIVVNLGFVDFAEADNISTLLSYADTACNLAREQGPNTIYIYSQARVKSISIQKQVRMISKVLRAIDRNAIYATRQQIVNCSTQQQQQVSYEFFVRIRDEKNESYEPAMFLNDVKRFNVMPKLDEWMFNNLVHAYAIDNYKLMQSISILFINLCYESLCDTSIQNRLYNLLNQYKKVAVKMCIELNESQLARHSQFVSVFMKRFAVLGVKFALCDFGIGGCSCALLSSLPFSYVKITTELTKDIDKNEKYQIAVKGIVAIAKGLKLGTLATKVETASEFKVLADLGVDYCQGCYLSRPENANLTQLQMMGASNDGKQAPETDGNLAMQS